MYKSYMGNISTTLRELIKKEKVSMRGLAKAIGADRASLYRALEDNGNPERKTIEKILDNLGYEIRFTKSKRKEVKPIKPKPSKSTRKHREVI